MANARTRFDTIRDYMVRSHSATSGTLYGKPCALLNGHAFLYFHQDWAAFLLKGRVRLQALALPGARFWDPLGREGPSMDWVIVPSTHFLRWDRLAIEAVKTAHAQSGGKRPIAGPASGPPEPPPAANRWINSIKSLFAKAASITLAQQEELPEKPISRVFAETGADLGDRDASEIAALAEPAAAESPAAQAPPEVSPEVPQGRASFAVDEPQTAVPDKPMGRASFAIDEPMAEPAPKEPKAAPAQPEVTDQPSEPAAFVIDESEPATPTGRASFAVADDPPESADGPAVRKISEPAVSAGRASFSIGSDSDAEADTDASGPGLAQFEMSDPEPAVVTDQSEAIAETAVVAEAKVDAPSWALSTDESAEIEPEAAETTTDEAADAAAWEEKIAKFQLEMNSDDEPAPAPTEGRATFSAREPDPLPSVEPKFKIKEPEQPMGRASFLVADDSPAADESDSKADPDAPEGLDYVPPSKE